VNWPGRRPRRPHNARQSGANRGAHRHHPQLVPNLAPTRHPSPRMTTGAPAATPTPRSPVTCGKSTWHRLASRFTPTSSPQSSGRFLHHVIRHPRKSGATLMRAQTEPESDQQIGLTCRLPAARFRVGSAKLADDANCSSPPSIPAGPRNEFCATRGTNTCRRFMRSPFDREPIDYCFSYGGWSQKAALDATPSGTSHADQHALSEEEGCQLSPLKPTLQNGELWGPRRPIWRR